MSNRKNFRHLQEEIEADPERAERLRSLSDEEGRELFDQAARFYLGISGTEFLRLWDSGYYDDDLDQPGVMSVVMLIPFATPNPRSKQ